MKIKIELTLFLLLFGTYEILAQSPTITGPSGVRQGGSATYYFGPDGDVYSWAWLDGACGDCSASGSFTQGTYIFNTIGKQDVEYECNTSVESYQEYKTIYVFGSVTNQNGSITLSRKSTDSNFYWQTTANGTDKSTIASASTYTVFQSGTYYLRRSYNNTWYSSDSYAITVTANYVPIPSVPTVASNCGNSVLTRGNPPSGVTWYWQGTNANGTSTTNSSLTYTASVNGTYYLRARNSSGLWSTASSSVNVTITPIPGLAIGSNNSRCDIGAVTLTASPGSNGNSIRWYNASSGGTLLYTGTSYTTPNLSGSTTYYAASYNSTTSCEATNRKAISAIINPIPGLPDPTGDRICGEGSVQLNVDAGSNANTIRWYNESSGGTLLHTGTSYTTPFLTQNTTYYISSFLSTGSGCESLTRVPITATIYSAGDDLQVCLNENIMLSGSPGGGTWSGPGVSGNTFNAVNAGAGAHVITYFYAEDQYCSPSDTRIIEVYNLPSSPSSPTVGKEWGRSILTRGNPPTGHTWYWQGTNPDGTDTSNSNSTYVVTTSGNYYLRAQSSTTACWSAATIVSVEVFDANGYNPMIVNEPIK